VEEVVFQSTKHEDAETLVSVKSYNNFNNNVVVTYENGETLIYYDCLADSATTLHISNCCKAFITFNPTHKMKVGGISGIQTCAEGHGTIILELVCNG